MAWPLTPLCELARKYGCEKGGQEHPFHTARYTYAPVHDYTPVYWELFGFWAAEVKNVLEIGINEGRSLRMWRDFFPNATIIGFDINPRTLIQEDRIRSFVCDQGDEHSLMWALFHSGNKKYDIIIDDGGHLYKEQAVSLKMLCPHYMVPEGIYVIEDANNDTPPLATGLIPSGCRRRTYRWENAPNDMLQVITQAWYNPPLPFRRISQVTTDWS